MIIDLITDRGIAWMRYQADIAPRVGETISTLEPEAKTFEVTSVDHLVSPDVATDNMKQLLITVNVEEI